MTYGILVFIFVLIPTVMGTLLAYASNQTTAGSSPARCNPATARKILTDAMERFPTSSLAPETRQAVARTFEQEKNWPAARNALSHHILENHPILSRVTFARPSGSETKKLGDRRK